MSGDGWVVPAADGVILSVQLVPRASRDAVAGLVGDSLKIRLRAPPVEGKANKALQRFLAESLGLRPADVAFLGGEKSRRKRLAVRGITVPAARRLLQPPGETPHA